MIASYAFSGLLSGVFRKFGKIGVAIGFLIGNIILAYVAKGNTFWLMSLKEFLIATVALLVIPKNVENKIEKIIGFEPSLPEGSSRSLGQVENTIYTLNGISDVFDDMTKINDVEEKEDSYIATCCNKICNQCSYNGKCIKNLIYENSQKLMEILEQNNKITVKDFDIVFNKNECVLINKMVDSINSEYPIYKINTSWKKKVEENRKIAMNQLKGISKTLNNVAKDLSNNNIKKSEEYKEIKECIKTELKDENINVSDIVIEKIDDRFNISLYIPLENKDSSMNKIYTIEKVLSKNLNQKIIASKNKQDILKENNICIQKFVSEPNYKVSLGISRTTKNRSMVSGDSNTFMELPDGKFLIALSDGMGSGEKAECNSRLAIKMLEKMLSTGFDKYTALELINSNLMLRNSEEGFSTIDLSILDLYKGESEFVKLSAAPTFIKNKEEVKIIKTTSLPVRYCKRSGYRFKNTKYTVMVIF